MPAPVVVSAGELFVWFALLLLVVWSGSTALQRLVALRFGGFATMAADYAATGTQGMLPRFAPPAWLYGPVWASLYGLHAAAGYRLRGVGNWTDAASLSRTPLALLATMLSLLLVWPAVYSGALLRRLGNLVHASALAVAVAAAVLAWDVDIFAACVFVATSAWLAYALLVAIGIERNRSAAACCDTAAAAAATAAATATPLPLYGRAGAASGVSVMVAPPDAYGPAASSGAVTTSFGASAPQESVALTQEQRRAQIQENERRALAEARAAKRNAVGAGAGAASTSYAGAGRAGRAAMPGETRQRGARGYVEPSFGQPGTFDEMADLDI